MLGLYGLGAVRTSRRPSVIVYHSFDESGSPISISPGIFRQHLTIIKKLGYETVTAARMVEASEGGPALPEKAVVLTFDDGLWNNYEVALPLLEEFGFTATIFLVTGYTGRPSTWERAPGIPVLPLLTWDKVKEMERLGIDFQPHSVSHPHLTRLSDKDLEDELLRSRRAIEEKLGKSAPLFCYPYGEFDARVMDHLKRQGFKAAFAGHPAREEALSLKRVGSAHITTGLAYRAALMGSFQHFYSLKRTYKRV